MSQTQTNITGFVIDGSNIASINASPKDKTKKPQDRVELLPVLLIVIELVKQGREFVVYFDGNFRHGEKVKPYIKQLNQLLSQEQFVEATSVQADNYIVQFADAKNWGIISNDRYRDDKFTKYAWLQQRESPRIVRASLASGLLMLTGGLEANVDASKYDIESAFNELFCLLNIPTIQSTNAKPQTISEQVYNIIAGSATPTTPTKEQNIPTPPNQESPTPPSDTNVTDWLGSEDSAQPQEPTSAQKLFARMQKELRERNNGTFKG